MKKFKKRVYFNDDGVIIGEEIVLDDIVSKLDELVEWVNNVSERIGRMEDEYKRHLYGGSGLKNIVPTGMDKQGS